MIELEAEEMKLIEDNIKFLETDDTDGFLHAIKDQTNSDFKINKIKCFMYEQLGVDLFKYSGPNGTIVSTDTFRAYCEAPETITLPDGIKAIHNKAFNNLLNVKKIIIPDSVESISSSAFYDCSDLEEVVLPNNPRYDFIRPETFRYCSKLKAVMISDSIKEIGHDAFYSCGEGKYILAHWRDNPEDQIEIPTEDIDFYKEHFKFVD